MGWGWALLLAVLPACPAAAAVTADDPRYQQARAAAETLHRESEFEQVLESCREAPPVSEDLPYRLICLIADENRPDITIPALFDIHVDALGQGKADLAAQALSIAAWRQSETGDIRGAFGTYERALAMGERLSPAVLNDITLNTGGLYVMYGDPEYVAKGVELHQLVITRLQEMKKADPANTSLDFGISLTQHNIGVAHALHLDDHAHALEWFDRVDRGNGEFIRSALVFSALSALQLGRLEDARRYLSQSHAAPRPRGTPSRYLRCYQELVQLGLDGHAQLAPCRDLDEREPLQVKLDLAKRMAVLEQPEWRMAGLEAMHRLFIGTLEAQLKQGSIHGASRAELNRLQAEAKLQDELVEKERALKRMEQQRLTSLRLLAGALVAILLLVLLVILLRLRQDRKLARHFHTMSLQDGLTGLHNRRYFEQHIEAELERLRRAGPAESSQALALCLVDIDHFKRINDTHGHAAGDTVLVEAARRLRATLRDADMVVRWGGEEFLLATWVKDRAQVGCVIERVRQAFADQPIRLPDGTALDVTCTIGAIALPATTGSAAPVARDRLLQLADAALYLGKEQRDCWICIEEVIDPVVLAQDVDGALVRLEAEGRLRLACGPCQPSGHGRADTGSGHCADAADTGTR